MNAPITMMRPRSDTSVGLAHRGASVRVRRLLVVAVIASVLASLRPRTAAAEDRIKNPKVVIHLPIAAGLGAYYILGQVVFTAPLSKDTCRWCPSNSFDNAVRDRVVWNDRELADLASDYTGFLGAPVFALGAIGIAAHLDGHGGSHWFHDAFIIAESAAVAGALNFTSKISFGRERPFVHDLAPADKPFTESPEDNNLSFYSGHATISMTFAVSAGTVASLRGYRWAPAIYAGGISLSLATGYLRVAGDKHWATDAIVGWATGAAIGYSIPRFLHSKRSSIVPVVTGSTAGIAFTW